MESYDKQTVFYVLLGISLLLTRTPVIGKYFRVVNTMIHESGHALMTLFTSGSILKVELFSSTEGDTVTKSSSRFCQMLIALAGYPFSSAAAYFFFYLIKTENQLIVLYLLVAFSLLNLIFLVRNGYGIFWLITFSALLVLAIYFKNEFIIYAGAIFLSLIVLTDSIISAFHLFIISIAKPQNAGDAKNLKTFTGIPVVFWSLMFMVLALWVGYKSIALFFNIPSIPFL